MRCVGKQPLYHSSSPFLSAIDGFVQGIESKRLRSDFALSATELYMRSMEGPLNVELCAYTCMK